MALSGVFPIWLCRPPLPGHLAENPADHLRDQCRVGGDCGHGLSSRSGVGKPRRWSRLLDSGLLAVVFVLLGRIEHRLFWSGLPVSIPLDRSLHAAALRSGYLADGAIVGAFPDRFYGRNSSPAHGPRGERQWKRRQIGRGALLR